MGDRASGTPKQERDPRNVATSSGMVEYVEWPCKIGRIITSLTTVLAQRAEDSAGRAAWFPGSFATVASVGYRIPGIAEHGAAAPKGPKQISPGQSAAPPRVREAGSRQSPERATQTAATIVSPFQGLFDTMVSASRGGGDARTARDALPRADLLGPFGAKPRGTRMVPFAAARC